MRRFARFLAGHSARPPRVAIRAIALVAMASVFGCAGGGTRGERVPADVVFLGGTIYTVDRDNPDAEAVAVRDDRIVAVGSRSEVEGLVGNETRVIELGRRALVPGFIDAHGHFTLTQQFLGMLNASSPPVGPMENIDQIVAALRERIESRSIPAGQVVAGYGYDDSLLAENRHPTRDDLDRASTEHPILIIHVSGHLATANSRALEMMGFDETTADPYGGVIRRRPGTNEPNGVLEEVAAHMGLEPLMTSMGQPTPEQFLQSVQATVAYHAGFGITTIQDGASSVETARAFAGVAASNPLDVDLAVFPVFRGEKEAESLDALGYSRDYENGVRVAGVKFVLDGSPQGRTAWLTDPYHAGPPGADADYVAYSMVEPVFYKKHVKRLLEAGIPVIAHANGDAAIDLMIEGVDEALAGETKDHRSVTIHAQLTREDQLDDMKRLGIVPSFFAAHPFFWGDWHRLSFGDDRAMRISPLRSARNRELPFTIHNDAPVVPPDIMLLLEVAMGRMTREGVVLGADQRIGFDEALHAVTLGAAYQYFEEDEKGSISVGKRADLVILERDPAAGPIADVSEVGIIETFARGKSVYAAP